MAGPHADHVCHEHDAHPKGGHRPTSHAGSFTAGEARQAKRLALVLTIVGLFFVLELGGAVVADSVVLQADALHLLMDVFALGMSLFAMRLAVRRPTPHFTYGLRRAEPVAAIFSAVLVLATTVAIVVEAMQALRERTPPRAGIMLVVSIMALGVNGLSAWLLHDAIGHSHPHSHDPDNPDEHPEEEPASARETRPHAHSLNIRGAWLHLLGDTLGALAALCAAIVIRSGGPAAADPIASFAVAAILCVGSLRLLRVASHVLFEAAPPHLRVDAVRQVILAFPGVIRVHDLHVWTLGAGHDAVTVHVRTDSRDATLGQRLSERIRATLQVEYVTVQVEVGEGPGFPIALQSPPPSLRRSRFPRVCA